MSETSSRGPLVEYLLFAAMVIGVSLVLCLLGAWPTRRLGGEASVAAMPIAVTIAALGSLIGGIPVLWARFQGSVKPHVALVSMLSCSAIARMRGVIISTSAFRVTITLSPTPTVL